MSSDKEKYCLLTGNLKSTWSKNRLNVVTWRKLLDLNSRGGGTRKNFDRDARVIFWGLKFHDLLFFWVAQNESYFLGGLKNKHYFFGVAEKRNYRITS